MTAFPTRTWLDFLSCLPGNLWSLCNSSKPYAMCILYIVSYNNCYKFATKGKIQIHRQPNLGYLEPNLMESFKSFWAQIFYLFIMERQCKLLFKQNQKQLFVSSFTFYCFCFVSVSWYESDMKPSYPSIQICYTHHIVFKYNDVAW